MADIQPFGSFLISCMCQLTNSEHPQNLLTAVTFPEATSNDICISVETGDE